MDNEKGSDKSSYEKLKDLILDRKLQPNTRLTETFLAEQLNLSRIPIREAIQQLVHEGFIERHGKNGYQIKTYNEQDIIDLYNYREAMDGMLARLFTQRADASQLYYLQMNVEAMEEKLEDFNHDSFSKIDIEFHQIIARGARNQYMENQHEIILEKVIYVADRIYQQIQEKDPTIQNLEAYRGTLSQHKSIFQAIQAGDPDAAEAAARDSVKNGLMKALQSLSRRH